MDNVETEVKTQRFEAVEKETQKPDFTSRYEGVYKRFHDLKEKGQARDIHEAFGDLNYLILLSGKEGGKYVDVVGNENVDKEELKVVRDNYASYLDSLKDEKPDMLRALEDELSDFEQKLAEKEEETGSESSANTLPIEVASVAAPNQGPSDNEPSFVERVREATEDEKAAKIMDQYTDNGEEDDMLRGTEETRPTSTIDDDMPIRSPFAAPGLNEVTRQHVPPVPMPENIVPPIVLPPEDIRPPVQPPPEGSIHPPTKRVFKNEELTRTERQKFLIEEIRVEAEKVMEALRKPKNFDIANMDEYKESLLRMQTQRQELYLNIQNNLPRGSFVLGWRMTQFMRSNKLLQSEAEKFMNDVDNGDKPNIDRFKIAEKLYREWEHKLQRWYEEHDKNWDFADLVKKKTEKYKNKPQKLYKELNKASSKLDRRVKGVPEGDFWDVLENFNLLYSAFRETMSSTAEAQNLVGIYARQLNGANTLRKIAETGKGVEGDIEDALSNYKNGVQERNKIKKVKIKPNGRKYVIDVKFKGGD